MDKSMLRYKIIIAIGISLIFSCSASKKEIQDKGLPNVLFIAIDDLNDWVGCLGGHPQAHTPNIDRMAANGILFTNANCSVPGCSPSRNSLLTGKEPTSTGYYPFYVQWNETYLPGYVTLPQYFKENGYDTFVSGKIHHNMVGQNPKYGQRDWTENNLSVLNKLPNLITDKNDRVGFDDETTKWVSAPTVSPLEDHADYQTALYGVNLLQKKHDTPFFLALGFIKPHLPFVAPKKYFNLFNKETIQLPVIEDDDLNDVPWAGRSNARLQQDAKIRELGIRKGMIRGYLAASSFIDDMIGMVINALEKSPYKNNTIIVLWSDHGYHHGEKQTFTKFSLWEESTRVPFVIIDPRMKMLAGTQCSTPISLINVYPTLVDMCGLKEKKDLDGRSLVPLLKNPKASWEQPALTTWGRGNYSLRTEKWRYTKYFDGSEELYNHENDSNEWINLANNMSYKKIKIDMQKWIPKVEAKLQPNGILSPVDADNHDLESFKKQWEFYNMIYIKNDNRD